MPVMPWLGYTPKTWVSGPQYVGYSAPWNLLNYASVIMPVSTVSVEKDAPDDDWLHYAPRNAADEFNYKQCRFYRSVNFLFIGHKELTQEADDVNLVNGLPVPIQIVGGKFGEENSIGVAKVIDALMNKV